MDEWKEAGVQVRRIPAVHHELVEVMKNNRAPTEALSARSSGDPNLALLTTLETVVEVPFEGVL